MAPNIFTPQCPSDMPPHTHTHTLNFSLSLYDNISVFADSNFWLRSQGGKKTPSRWCKSERSVSTYKAVLARLRKRKSYPPKCHHHPPGKPSMCDGFPPRGVNGGRGGKKTKERHHYGCDCDLAWTEVGQTLHYQQFTFSSFKQPSSIAHTSTLSLSSTFDSAQFARVHVSQASARGNWWRNNRRETTLSKQ